MLGGVALRHRGLQLPDVIPEYASVGHAKHLVAAMCVLELLAVYHTALLGKVPYLNGGIFDPHALERENPGVSIPDSAFRQVFDFFDQYQWHLDDRPTGADNEINPDVLGYIFEKYVNQKQMGAYYTKEDITGYIARNTVIPRLLEMARAECPVAFDPGGGVWRLLRDDPDNYIYPALGHGVAWDYSPDGAVRLEEPLPLPVDIAAGLDDPARRTGWNRAAPPDYALPTETWRELIARRRRYEEVRGKLAAGEVSDVNDLVTSTWTASVFARDVIVNSEGPELVRAIWRALSRVSVLDPACGSGAFLFAALNILEPLYSAVMQAMREFREDLETTQRPRSPNALSDFREPSPPPASTVTSATLSSSPSSSTTSTAWTSWRRPSKSAACACS